MRPSPAMSSAPHTWVRGPKDTQTNQEMGPAGGSAPPTAPPRVKAAPRGPQRGPGAPRRNNRARTRSRHAVGWVKAHGGAGATSLADLLGGADLGQRWPQPAKGEPNRIVLVGRTSAHGLRSVSQALGELRDDRAPDELDLLAVVLMADAPGRLPLSLLSRIRVIRSVVHVHRVPWIPAWRLDRSPKALPVQLTRLADLVGADVSRAGAAS